MKIAQKTKMTNSRRNSSGPAVEKHWSMPLYVSMLACAGTVSVLEPAEPFSENTVSILCHLMSPRLHTSQFLAISINGMANNADLWVRK